LFKSYYVVWKLQGSEGFQYVDRVFKSYYVVWKLFRRTQTAKWR